MALLIPSALSASKVSEFYAKSVLAGAQLTFAQCTHQALDTVAPYILEDEIYGPVSQVSNASPHVSKP